MKKIVLVLFLILATLLSGCNGISNNNDSSAPVDSKENELETDPDLDNDVVIENETLEIYDISNKVIGQFEHYGAVTQLEDGFIYAKIPTGRTDKITKMDYYRYVFATKENIKIGTIENWSYEAGYCNSYISNHLFISVTTDINVAEKRTLKILDIDLDSNTMSEISSEKGGFPYNSMTVAGNRVLITKVVTNGSNLEEYNTETKETKKLMSFAFDDKSNVGEAVRQITSDGSTISLLILKMEVNGDTSLRMDVYDYEMKFLYSVDMSTIHSDENELRQGVAHFSVLNDYVYYENFSLTRFLGRIEENTVKPIFETNPTFAIASEIVNSKDTDLFYQSFSTDNDLYLLNSADGTIKKAIFYADDERYQIINISRDKNDQLLISMYFKDPDTGKKLPPRLYYINLSDLNFTNSQNGSVI